MNEPGPPPSASPSTSRSPSPATSPQTPVPSAPASPETPVPSAAASSPDAAVPGPDAGRTHPRGTRLLLEFAALALWLPASAWVSLATSATGTDSTSGRHAGPGTWLFLGVTALIIGGLPGAGAWTGSRLARRRDPRRSRFGAAVGALLGALLVLALTAAAVLQVLAGLHFSF